MGSKKVQNVQKPAEKFSLKIAVDQNTVFPGFEVSGVLQGHVEEDTPNVQMRFKLLGEISTSIDISSQFPQQVGQKKEVFLEKSYIIYEGQVSKGDKNKDFKLTLPNDIPPSASYQKTDDGNPKADIQYKIQVEVSIDNTHILTTQQMLKVIAKLELKEQPKFIPKLVEKKNVTSKSGFMALCFKPTGVEMQAVLSKGFTRPGDTVYVQFQGTNFSQTEIVEIFVALNQLVDIKQEGVFQKSGRKELLGNSHPGFSKSVEEKFEVKIPSVVDLYSFETDSFSCQYEVEVRLVLADSENVVLAMPLQIVGAIETE